MGDTEEEVVEGTGRGLTEDGQELMTETRSLLGNKQILAKY